MKTRLYLNICNYFLYLNPFSISIEEDSIVEYCDIGEGTIIGRNCIISNLRVPANAQIPDGSYLHCIPVQVDGVTHFTTFAFGSL